MPRDDKNTAVHSAYDEQDAFDFSVPEKNLLKAVLLSAISDLNRPGELGRRANEYLLNGDEKYIFSFRSICEHLSIDPKRILRVAGLLSAQDGACTANVEASKILNEIADS